MMNIEQFNQLLEKENRNWITIDNHNFVPYLNLDVVAFSFAEGGAMGSPGKVVMVTKDRKWFSTNYAFGTIAWNTLIEVLPVLLQCSFEYRNTECPPQWQYVDLGAGNHLVVKKDLMKEFNRLTEGISRPSQMYQCWMGAIDSILKDNK